MRFVALALLCLGSALAQDYSFDGFYRGDEGDVFNKQPNSFLVRMIAGLKPGKALDVGMGQGRNALYLASKGWEVTGFDPSRVGVELAQKEATARKLQLTALVTTSEKFDWGREQWDLIVLTYMGVRALPDRIFESLRPRGLVLIESFHADTGFLRVLGEHWKDNELLQVFGGPRFRVIQYEDTLDKQDWGTQYGAKNRLVRLLAQKPAPGPTGCEFDGKSYAFGEKGGRPGELPMTCTAEGWKFAR